MNAHRFAPPYNDDAIVARIDGEMCRADAQLFEEQLKCDERLAGRTDELMKSSQDYAGAFASLLDDAPLETMQARLAALPDPQSATPTGVSRRALIAASVSFCWSAPGWATCCGLLLPQRMRMPISATSKRNICPCTASRRCWIWTAQRRFCSAGWNGPRRISA